MLHICVYSSALLYSFGALSCSLIYFLLIICFFFIPYLIFNSSPLCYIIIYKYNIAIFTTRGTGRLSILKLVNAYFFVSLSLSLSFFLIHAFIFRIIFHFVFFSSIQAWGKVASTSLCESRARDRFFSLSQRSIDQKVLCKAVLRIE